ncbi:hypothetical protein EJB05_31796, partial [Eragrostis curvula]
MPPFRAILRDDDDGLRQSSCLPALGRDLRRQLALTIWWRRSGLILRDDDDPACLPATTNHDAATGAIGEDVKHSFLSYNFTLTEEAGDAGSLHSSIALAGPDVCAARGCILSGDLVLGLYLASRKSPYHPKAMSLALVLAVMLVVSSCLPVQGSGEQVMASIMQSYLSAPFFARS